MNLLIKNLSHNICFTCVPLHGYVYNRIGLTSAQYYTCINKLDYDQSKVELKNLEKRNISLLLDTKHKYLSLKLKLNETFKNFFISSKRRYYGYLWYKSLDVIKVSEYFSILQMPDTFYSRFKVLELYMWMLLYHLPQGNRYNNLVRIGLIEAMWEDNQNRAKMLDSYNISLSKNMKILYEEFKVSLLIYDLGFSSNDADLFSSLWYNFYNKKDVDPRLLEVLVSFVRHQMNHLNKLNLEILTEKSEKSGLWLPLEPHFKEVFKKS